MNSDTSITIGIKVAAEKAAKVLSDTAQEADKASKSMDSLGKSIKRAFNTSGIVAFSLSMKHLIDGMIKIATPQAEFIENLNLMDVAFKENSDSAYKLLENMNDVFGLDPSSMAKQLGTYRQMASAMNIDSDTAALLSENLLKLQDDVSSLYNLSTDTVFSKFQSAMAGQSRAVRSLGVDITTTGLQNELYRRGIDMTVDSLNSASKEVLIYLTMEHQLQNAQGDLAKTSESVANQIRIFKEEINILARQIGAFLIPVLKTILPVLNGIIMALNVILSIVLGLFGIDAKSLSAEFGIASNDVSTLSNDFGNLGSNIGKTTKAAKEARKELRGFDKLNAIYSPTPSSGSSGGGGGASVGGIGGLGGIPKELRDQLKDYNNKMSEVYTKAQKIRDAILKALGFTKDLNGQWKFGHLTLASILAILVGVGGIIWALSRVLRVFGVLRGFANFFGGKTKKLKKGDAKDVADSISGAADVGDTVNKRSDSFKLPSFGTVLKGIAELALIVGALVGLVAAIGALCQIDGFRVALNGGMKQVKDLAIMLAIAVVPFGVFSAGVVVLGKVGLPSTLGGIVSMAAIILGLESIVGAVGLLASSEGAKKAINGGIEMVEKLSEMLIKAIIPIGLLCAGIVALGSVAAPAVLGIGTFVAIIFSLVSVVEAFGILSSTNGFNELVTTGGEALFRIADIIGGFAGKVISSFVEKSFEGIPKIGTQLSTFMTNLQPFIDGSKNIDPNTATAVETLAKACMIMTATQLIENISIWNKIAGKTSIEAFGESLAAFGKYFKKYSDNINGLKPDVVIASSNAAESLAELAHKIPNDGGLAGLLAGNNNIGEWSKSLPTFGANIKKYSDNISQIGGDFTSQSSKVVSATREIADMARDIPNEGGAVAFIVGDNGIKEFGWGIYKFGDYFGKYSNAISQVKFDKVSQTTKELKKIVDVARDIKDNKLSEALKRFADSMQSALGSLARAFSTWQANSIGYNFGLELGKSIVKGLKNTNFPSIRIKGLDGAEIAKAKINVYANGGFPEDGLFFANHNEMVGKFSNGKNVVANNNQIVSGITAGVRSAIISTRRSSQNLNLNVTADDDSIARFFKFKQDQDNRQFGF